MIHVLARKELRRPGHGTGKRIISEPIAGWVEPSRVTVEATRSQPSRKPCRRAVARFCKGLDTAPEELLDLSPLITRAHALGRR